MHKSEISMLFGQYLKAICLNHNETTQEETNTAFKRFKVDVENADAGEILRELNLRLSALTPAENAKSRCFDIKAINLVKTLINDIDNYAVTFAKQRAEQMRLEQIKQIKTFADILEYLQKELIEKDCYDWYKAKRYAESYLTKINSKIYLYESAYSKSEFRVYVDTGKEHYHYDRYSGRYRDSCENCFLFTIKIGRTQTKKAGMWNSAEYKIKKVSFPYCTDLTQTIDGKIDEWLKTETARKNAVEEQADAFNETLAKHGFSTLEEIKEWLSSATSAQRKIIIG